MTEPGPSSPTDASNRERATQHRLGASYYKLFGASTISNLGDGISAIAYPWLATAVTRNGLLIALVALAQRLPWLVLTLPAGVVTDRRDRRSLMIVANWSRAAITLVVAVLVMARQGGLASPDELAAGVEVSEDLLLYGMVLVAAVLLGAGEVFYDNAAQTFMPSVVASPQLEKANGRLWSAEMVANVFVGPPLAAALLAVAFAVPFMVDAATFAVSAVLITLIPPVTRQSGSGEGAPGQRAGWRQELIEGFRWLWAHDVLRPMAISLGALNLLGAMTGAVMVLFAQEILSTSATEFALLTTGGAAGGVVGGWIGSSAAQRLGPGPSLSGTVIVGGVTSAAIGMLSWWPAVWVLFAAGSFVAVLWNVITVSFRQTIIPDHLLGRVNSVYRFFGWGMMPIGALLGGVTVTVGELFLDRQTSLRLPWLVAGMAHLALLAFVAPRLTSTNLTPPPS